MTPTVVMGSRTPPASVAGRRVTPVEWNELPMAGAPHLAAASGRIVKTTCAWYNWMLSAHPEGSRYTEHVNNVQLFRVGTAVDHRGYDAAVERVKEEFVRIVEMTLEWGEKSERAGIYAVRTMDGVRSILGRGFRPGEDKLSLAVLRKPKLRTYEDWYGDAVELLAEFTLVVEGVPAVKGCTTPSCVHGCARCKPRSARAPKTCAVDYGDAPNATIQFLSNLGKDNKKEAQMGVKVSDLKVGDKIILPKRPGTRVGNAQLLVPGEPYEVVAVHRYGTSSSSGSPSVDIHAEHAYGRTMNLAEGFSLDHMEKVAAPGVDCSKLRVGDRVRATASSAFFNEGDTLVVTRAHGGGSVALRNERTGRRNIIASTRGGYGARLELVKDEPRVTVTQRLMTDMEIRCASGDGSKLIIGYDPMGNENGDGPCLDFVIEDSVGRNHGVFVDVEDFDTMQAISRFIDFRLADFHADTKK